MMNHLRHHFSFCQLAIVSKTPANEHFEPKVIEGLGLEDDVSF